MTIAYFDCFSGASGDMILGALVDAGAPLAKITRELAKLRIGEFRIDKRKRKDFAGTDLRVVALAEPDHAHYGDIDRAISRAPIAKGAKELAREVFRRLAEAEARVHGTTVEKVHFHEVGAVDSIVDIVGSAIALEQMGFREVHCSPLPLSRGTVRCAHGELPVPAPATLELIRGVPLRKTDVEGELVTPTGAAILTAVASHFGESPLQRIDRVGVGFGDRKIPGRPNILRLMIGDGFRAVAIESDMDDMNPELFDNAMQRMFAAGAVDVTLQPIQMKKNRPGVRLACVAPWAAKDRVIDAVLSETTTFGVRYWDVERRMLARELAKGRLKRGGISFKIGRDGSGRIVKAVPEHEDVKRIAKRQRRPLIDVYNEATAESAGIVRRGR
ncbi:MAG: nickel pincer cofactor biosynthesis protein LarC [Proteobacteria bacterium]|nr:nickel pincer cofactor biosynthesis protein LarC [Pseudomonadota bacterium]